MCADCQKHMEDAAGAAALRRAFYEAVADFQAVKNTIGLSQPYVEVWRKFYMAIVEHSAGMNLLAELKKLKEAAA